MGSDASLPGKPAWLALFAPLPSDVKAERKPVASAEQIENGTAGPIAGWQSLGIHLSAPQGSRHVLVTVDETGKVLSGGDHVMLVIRDLRGTGAITLYDHESVGGRYADDGTFHGTRWITQMEQEDGADDARTLSSTPSQPSAADIASINAIVAEVVKRAQEDSSGSPQ